MKYPGFIGGSAPSQSVLATSERTMNLYVEKVGSEGTQNRMALYPTPGFRLWGTVAANVNGRCGISINGRTFIIIGTGLYEFFSDGTSTLRGTIAADSNLPQIVSNGSGGQLGIASGGNAYCFTLSTNTLLQVLTGECTQIGMLDTYLIAFNQTLGKIRLSELNDGSTWDPTQFALRSAQPDMWQAMIINAPDIILLGEWTGDVWYDAGTSPFPLAARAGLTIPYGIAATFSLAVTGGQSFWLAKNKDGSGIVVKMQGYSPQKISTPELDTAIAVYKRTTTISDAEALVYQEGGHTFYVLSFPTANRTWAYDLTTGIWAERGKWTPAQNDYNVWAPRMHVSAFGLNLIGERGTGNIYTMDMTLGSETDGTAIRRLRRGPLLINENNRIQIDRFELSIQTGVGLVSGQGSNPQIMAHFSTDGGNTWGNEVRAGLGRMGEYYRRVFWTMLGSPRLFVPEITITDPVPCRIIDAFINPDQQDRQAA